MSDLASHLADYLKLRRAAGFKLVFDGTVLPQFVAYVQAAGSPALTVDLAVEWAGLPQDVLPISLAHRLGAIRGFARYLKAIDPATEIPPLGIWPSRAPRPAPYLWSAEEIDRLLHAARGIGPPLRAATYETLFALLAVTGMRIGEAMGLGRNDIDFAAGVITIREAKFDRERLVPVHSSTADALTAYACRRDERFPRSASFFVSTVGTALRYSSVRATFIELATSIGLRTATQRPRIHDLRHSFTVRTLIQWHRSGTVIAAGMPVLSTYLGHVNPSGTYWYLSAAPELMELAAARLEGRFGGRS